MIVLSYSTINALINEPHTWLCKQMGLETFSSRQMNEGKAAHRVIQDHVSGKIVDKRLIWIKVQFPLVEDMDRDEKMRFYYEFNDKYAIHGYMDGKDPENKRFLEIKTSSKPWSLKRFNDLMQWKVYALANPEYNEVWMITGTRDLNNIDAFNLKIIERNRQEARTWIQEGIDIIEKGDFSYNGSGKSPCCWYKNCPFCNN